VIGRCALQLRHSVSAGSLLAPTTGRCCNNDSSCDVINGTSSSSSSSSAQQLQSTRDHLIVKVFLQTDDTHETINYKSILVSDSWRIQFISFSHTLVIFHGGDMPELEEQIWTWCEDSLPVVTHTMEYFYSSVFGVMLFQNSHTEIVYVARF